MRRALVLASTFVLFSTFLTGCWNRREINELAIVSSVGVDKEDGLWRLTAEIFRPLAVGGEGGGGGGGGPVRQAWVVRGEGHTVFQAVRDMALKVPRRVYWAHCTAAIVGEEAARAGINEMLDFWDRDAELRRSTNILVCRGKAEDLIVGNQGSLEKTVGLEVVGLKKTARADAHSRITSIHEFLVALAASGADPLAAGLELNVMPEPPGLTPGGGGEGGGGQGGKGASGGGGVGKQPMHVLRLKGLALFRNDKLVGFFEPEEARGFNWVRGDITSTVINVKCPLYPAKRDDTVALELFRVGTKLEVNEKEGRPEVVVKVKAELGLANQGCPGDLTKPELTRSLERQAATVIRNEIEAAVAKAKSLGVDPFAFGEAIHRGQPKLWKKLEKDWPQGLKELTVKIDSRAKIRRNALSNTAPQESP